MGTGSTRFSAVRSCTNDSACVRTCPALVQLLARLGGQHSFCEKDGKQPAIYNLRPTGTVNLHAALDRAVWAAYGWDDPDPSATPDDTILARLLALNLARAGMVAGVVVGNAAG